MLLKQYNEDWSYVIKEVKGELKTTEEHDYVWSTEEDNSFIEIMLTANELVARL